MKKIANTGNNLNISLNKNKLLIIGLNDSQGVDTNFKINKKSFMHYIRKELDNRKIKYEMFDCFSLFFNKTYYIDSFFKHNIDKKSIRQLQIYGNIMALKKSMIDYSLPKCISNIRNIYRLTYPKVKYNKKITTELKNSFQPFIIYSSGANDLMKLIGTDPFSVIKQYKRRDREPNFYYSLGQATKFELVDDVISRIKDNLKLINSYNSNTIIFVLGLYIPTSLEKTEMKNFRDLIVEYNNKLKNTCTECNAIYIDTNEIGKRYNKKNYNFHISTEGHRELSKILINSIDFYRTKNSKIDDINCDNYDNTGLIGILHDVETMFKEYKNNNKEKNFRVQEIEKEFINELEVLNYVNNVAVDEKLTNLIMR